MNAFYLLKHSNRDRQKLQRHRNFFTIYIYGIHKFVTPFSKPPVN